MGEAKRRQTAGLTLVPHKSAKKAKDDEYREIVVEWVRAGAVEVRFRGRILSHDQVAALTDADFESSAIRKLVP